MWKLLLNFIPGVGPFLSAAADFVTKHWKFFVIAGMIGTLAYQNFSVHRFVFGVETIPHEQLIIKQDEAQIANLKDDLKQAVDANKKLTFSIGALNTTVGEWKSRTDELEAQNQLLQGNLDQMRVDTDKKVQDILNIKTPTTCKDSIDLLRFEREKLTW